MCSLCSYAFVVYLDASVADIACQFLNGMEMGDHVLTVRRDTETQAADAIIEPEDVNVAVESQHRMCSEGVAVVRDIMNFLWKIAEHRPRQTPPAPPAQSGRRKIRNGLHAAPEVVAVYKELEESLNGNAANASGGPKKIGSGAAADLAALIPKLEENSNFKAQVREDVEKYRPVIEDLIKKVSAFEAEHMKDMVEFVKEVDSFLAKLSDETFVLKQFEWPARYTTMLEAKAMYENLEKMKRTFDPWQKTAKTASEELKNIQKFMNKSISRLNAMLRRNEAVEKKFKENGIPWDPEIYTEVTIALLAAVLVYMEIVLEEVDKLMNAVREDSSFLRKRAIERSMDHLKGHIHCFSFTDNNTLCSGAIVVAYKGYQFAGGFTESCNDKFAEIAAKTRELKAST